MTSLDSNQTIAAATNSLVSGTTPVLQGKMTSWELLCSVLAFAAPVTSVSSLIPFVVQGGGIGAPVTILGAMVLMLVFSVGFLAMTGKVTKPGAFYAYVMEGCGVKMGQGAAFVAVFGYFTLGLCTAALLGPTISSFASEVLAVKDIPWYIGSALAISLSGLLSYLRIDLSAKVLTVAMFVEVTIVLLFDIVIPVSDKSPSISFQPLSPSHFFDGNFTVAFLYAIIIFIGFESTAIYRDEVKNPQVVIPRVTYIAVVFIGVFYALSAWMTIAAFGDVAAVAAAKDDAANMFMLAMNNYVGKVGVDATKGILILSAFASLLSLHNVLARYIYSLSRNGAIPALLGKTHAVHKSPYVGSLACTLGWAVVLMMLLGSDPSTLYAKIGGVGTYAVLILMLLTSFSVIMYFWRRRSFGFQTFWSPLIAFAGLLAFTVLTTFNFQYLIGGERGDGVWLQLLILGMFFYGYFMASAQERKRTTPLDNIA
ncbi:APC family permease [Pseudomonas sp. DR48]|uniref:APC family permease n=1 Tax=Pseudomonas sp. DR48 TaxID=2871095 RepID=UPI001C98FA2C|nr:APC family permease [Pseudomonas sp. DR48]QZP31645.1 APC family permease [Pseudomonas sp. DR48]